jgi:hypothetical protein
MPNVQQTKVTDSNRQDFYRAVYPMQKDAVDQLIDISFLGEPIVAIDCCGWHYAKLFNKPMIMVETTTSVDNYALTQDHYTHLLDDRNDILRWPDLPYTQDGTLLLDRSPLLKYRSLQELKDIVEEMIQKYRPSRVLIRGYLYFVDDCRLVDRLTNWFDFLNRPNFVTTRFSYDTDGMLYFIDFKRHQ